MSKCTLYDVSGGFYVLFCLPAAANSFRLPLTSSHTSLHTHVSVNALHWQIAFNLNVREHY